MCFLQSLYRLNIQSQRRSKSTFLSSAFCVRNNIVCYKVCCCTSGNSGMIMEHLWKDTVRIKQQYSEKTLSDCHYVQHKTHNDWPGIEPGPSPWTSAVNNRQARQDKDKYYFM